MEIINPSPVYPPAALIDPAPYGYIHLATTVAPPPGRLPVVPRNRERTALLRRLKTLAEQLEGHPAVREVTVYRAAVMPPFGGEKVPRFDVVVLVETTFPETIDEVRAAEPYTSLVEAMGEPGVMPARCARRIAEVDKTRQGLFLFNHFTTELDIDDALRLWDHLAGWYATQTGMDNSVLLQPIGEADYVFVNHARWRHSLPRFALKQFGKRSFRSYVLANLKANRTVSMPVLYRLA